MLLPRGSRFPRTSGVGQRRKTAWTEGPFGRATLSVAGSTLYATGQQAIVDGLTIVRIRGDFNAGLTSAAAVADGFDRIGVGMCIVNENAFGVGVTAIPSPLADMSWDGWIWHRTLSLVGMGIIAGGAADDAPLAPAAARFEIDGKAMRKWKNTDVLVGVVEVADEIGTATIRTMLVSRVLAKLP